MFAIGRVRPERPPSPRRVVADVIEHERALTRRRVQPREQQRTVLVDLVGDSLDLADPERRRREPLREVGAAAGDERGDPPGRQQDQPDRRRARDHRHHGAGERRAQADEGRVARRSRRSPEPLWSGWVGLHGDPDLGFALREAPVPSGGGEARARRARPRRQDDHQGAARSRLRGDLHGPAPDSGADRRDRAAGGRRRRRAVAAVRRPPHVVPPGARRVARPRSRRRVGVRRRGDPRSRRRASCASWVSARCSGRAPRSARSARGWRPRSMRGPKKPSEAPRARKRRETWTCSNTRASSTSPATTSR